MARIDATDAVRKPPAVSSADADRAPRGSSTAGMQSAAELPGDHIERGVTAQPWRDLPDPTPVARDVATGYQKRTDRTSVLDIRTATPQQQQQGELNDCFVVATLASTLAVARDRLGDVLEANDDGTVTVRLHEAEFTGTHVAPTGVRRECVVDRDLYERDGSRIYGQTWSDPDDPDAPARLELPLIEKALAAESYDNVDEPTSPAFVITQLLGVPAAQMSLDALAGDPEQGAAQLEMFLTMMFALQQSPVVFGTADDPERMAALDLAPGHAYALLSIGRNDNGDSVVTLMEPRRQLEPEGDDRADGVFEVPVAKLPELFMAVAYALPS